MSSTHRPPGSARTSRPERQPEPTLEDIIAELVNPPTGTSESKIILDKIQENASQLEETSAYANQLSQHWHNSEISPEDFLSVKARLVDDALNVNLLVEDQSKLVNESASILSELNDAWDATQTNLDVAMKLYHKAKLLPNQQTELQRLQARIAVLENEKSTKELLAEQQNELLDRISSTTAEKQELAELRTKVLVSDAEKQELAELRAKVLVSDAEKQELAELRARDLISDAERDELKGLRTQSQNTITDLNSTVKGIKDTTDQIAQAMNDMAIAGQSTNEQKRRSVTDIRQRSSSADREPRFAPSPTGPAGPRRTSVQMDSTLNRRSSLRNTRTRTEGSASTGQPSPGQPSPTQPSSSTQTTGDPDTVSGEGPAPETTTDTPPASSTQPAIEIKDYKDAEDVFSNILAWDGRDLFPMEEASTAVVDDVKASIAKYLVNLVESKFHNAFVASVNKPGMACVWQRSQHNPKSDPNGYHACKDCVAMRRVCVIRARNQTANRTDRPHMAPLPDNIRPANATRADPEYWVLPADEETSAES